MTVKHFPNKIVLLTELCSLVKGLDINKSAYLPFFGFVTDEGEEYLCNNAVDFVNKFNERFEDLLTIDHTRCIGNRSFIISFKEVKEQPKTEEVKEEIKETLDLSKSETKEFDKAYAESLAEGKSKTEAKEELNKYASEFGVELQLNKKFENMLADLEEALKQ